MFELENNAEFDAFNDAEYAGPNAETDAEAGAEADAGANVEVDAEADAEADVEDDGDTDPKLVNHVVEMLVAECTTLELGYETNGDAFVDDKNGYVTVLEAALESQYVVETNPEKSDDEDPVVELAKLELS
jgi:hypothetical protein